jgi:hypothetical protein
MRTPRDEKPKHRLFTTFPLKIYKAVVIAAKQNFCTITTWMIRAALMALERDGIDPNEID